MTRLVGTRAGARQNEGRVEIAQTYVARNREKGKRGERTTTTQREHTNIEKNSEV